MNFHHIGVTTDKSKLSNKERYSPLFRFSQALYGFIFSLCLVF